MSNPRDTDTNIDTHPDVNTDADTDPDDATDPFDYPKLVKVIEQCIDPERDLSIMHAATITSEMLPDKDEEPKLRNGTSFLLAEHILTVAAKIPYNHLSQVKLALYVQCLMQSEKLGYYVADDRYESVQVRCEEELTRRKEMIS